MVPGEHLLIHRERAQTGGRSKTIFLDAVDIYLIDRQALTLWSCAGRQSGISSTLLSQHSLYPSLGGDRCELATHVDELISLCCYTGMRLKR